jgi:hypothetical protein
MGDERGRGERNGGGEHRRAPPPRQDDDVPARGQHRQAGAGRRRDEREEWYLPVPVEHRMRREREQGSGRRRGPRKLAHPRERREGHGQRRHEERQPQHAELGERLEVEIVRVARLVRDRPFLEPDALERPGAGADERLATNHVRCHTPVVGPSVAGDGQHAVVEASVGGRLLLGERRPRALDHRPRAARSSDGGNDERDRERAAGTHEHAPRSSGGQKARKHVCRAGLNDCRGAREHEELAGEMRALALRRLQGRPGCGERR